MKALLRRWLGVGDVYVVQLCESDDEMFSTILAVSARLQGAELIKADYVEAFAESEYPATGSRAKSERMLANRIEISNHELQDAD